MAIDSNNGKDIDEDSKVEKIEDETKKSGVNPYIELYEDFSKQNQDKELFIDEIYNDTHGTLVSLKKFKNSNEKYKSLDDNMINTSYLSLKHKTDYLKRQNSLKNIKARILRFYDIKFTNFLKVEKNLSLLNQKDLNKLSLIDNLDDYLSSVLHNQKPRLKDFNLSFNTIFSNIDFDLLSNDEKEKVSSIIYSFKEKYSYKPPMKLDNGDILDILNLFKYKSLNKNLISSFIKDYFNEISLKDKESLLKINHEEIINEKKNYLKNFFPNFQLLDSKSQNELIDGIKSEDIYVKTNNLTDEQLIDIFLNNKYILKLGEQYQEHHNYLGTYIEDIITEDTCEKIGVENNKNLGKLDGFKDSLKQLSLFENPENIKKFKEGNIICMNTELVVLEDNGYGKMKPEKFTNKIFLKIGKIDSENKKFSYYNFGSKGVYNQNQSEANLKSTEFETFLNFVGTKKDEGDNIKNIEIFTSDEIQEKVNAGKIDVLESSILQKEELDIEGDKDFVINELLNQGKTEEEITDEIIEEYIENTNKKINELNYKSLIDSVNRIDPNGKEFGLDKGTTFVSSKGDYFTVERIDNISGEIILEDNDPCTFIDFFDRYKELSCERKSNATTFEQLCENAFENNDLWKGFKHQNGKILKKSTNDEKLNKNTNIDYNYLVSDNGKPFYKSDGFKADIVQIDKISGDDVSVYLGYVKEPDKKSKDKKKTFSMSSSPVVIKMSVLESWINNSKLRPESLDSHKDFVEENYETMDRSGNFFSRFFSRTSVNEILKGGEFWLESIKEVLNEGNEEHAARFAESVLGKVLPHSLKLDLKSKSEAAQKKRMEDYKQRLKDLDSGDSTKLVYKRLMNKNSSEPQKEAAMIFMMESYGSLYTKGALFPHRGKWLWYQAMGGEPGDTLFLEEQEKAAKLDIQFTEEDLIYSLVAKQCKKGRKPRRRGRLYKEVEALIGKGREEEFEKGKKDAGKKRTVGARVDFALDELASGSYPNAMGAFEEIVGKGNDGDVTLLNKLPFVMAFSGLAYDFDQKMVDGFKNNPNSGRTVMSSMFMMNPSKIDLFSETVLELSKDLSKIHGGKFRDMRADALKIYDSQHSQTSQEDKVKETAKFFDIYGDVLTRSMNMLTTGKTDELTKTDQIILIKKDDPGKGIYKKYYNTFKAFTENFSDFSKEEYTTDAFISEDGSGTGSGIIGMDTFKVAKDTLMQAQGGGFRQAKAGPQIWKGFINAINEVKNTSYSGLIDGGDEVYSRKIQEEIITDKLRGLLGGLLLHHGTNQNALKGVFDQGTSSFYTKFSEWGIKSEDFSKYNIGYERIIDLKDKKANSLLSEYVKNILDGTGAIEDNFSIPNITLQTKTSNENILNNN